ncbi:DNA adenine methylase [Marisediminicola sp. LYQ85]|uniref:DNA adenine methylase n=1 Tax=Marisediminicola sp. LYQ85 TaxID=3391062 RepID=UPI003983383F
MSEQLQPFLRWAGSKRWLVRELGKIAPQSFGNYYEPFMGSAAVYFALSPVADAFLSDALEPLVHCYQTVRDSPSAVAEAAAAWSTDKETYYLIRSSAFTDPVARAAQFLYLNKLCFNGLYRENQRGQFNVPYGRPKSSRVVFEGQLESAASRLQSAEITTSDFAAAICDAKAGDLVYLDPPYVAGHRTNGFVDYNAKIFSWDDQRRLADLFGELSRRGVHVIMSNADHSSLRELYEGFSMKSVERYSSMSANSGRRGKSTELLIVSESLKDADAR